MKKVLLLLSLSAMMLATPALADPPHLTRAMADVGRNPTGWKHKWCGVIMKKWTGVGGPVARSFATVGSPSPAVMGAIAVMPHHVAIIIKCQGNKCLTVSGNHTGRSGRRVVGVGWYSKSRFIAVRRI